MTRKSFFNLKISVASLITCVVIFQISRELLVVDVENLEEAELASIAVEDISEEELKKVEQLKFVKIIDDWSKDAGQKKTKRYWLLIV